MKKKNFLIAVLTVIFSASFLIPLCIARAESRLTASQECIDLIKETEGFSKYKYWDYSQWTIGYGTGIGADEYPNGISKEDAEKLLKSALSTYEGYVNKFANKYELTLKQNQFDAMVSLSYNMGNIWSVYDDFDLKNYVINGPEKYSFLEIAKAFGEWRVAGGKVLQGLVNRREDETKLFLSDRTDNKSEVWRVNTESGINLRKSPDAQSQKTGFLDFNTIYEVTEKKMSNGSLWGKVLVDGSYQWGVLDYSRYMVGGPIDYEGGDEPSEKTEQWEITSKNGVNLREGPGLGYKSLDVLDYKTKFDVSMTAEADEHLWGKTKYAGKTGWIALTYAKRVGEQQFESASLSSIRIKTEPKKTTYNEGDMLSLEGIEVMAKYSDGSEKQIVDFTVDGFKSTAGEHTITITYMEKTAKFKVTVSEKKLKGIEITKKPEKTLYKQGEEFSADGLTVEAIYDNDSREEVTEYGLSGYDLEKAGKQKITVEYKGFKEDFEIEVSKKVMKKLTIEKLPDKLEYIAGQVLDLSGMSVSASFDNDTKINVIDYSVSGYDPQTIGVQTISIEYNGFKQTFDVTVNEPDIFDLPGDVNSDGVRDVFDLVLLNRFIKDGREEFPPDRAYLADINGDGNYDQRDIDALSRIVSEQ